VEKEEAIHRRMFNIQNNCERRFTSLQ